jgi:hypothetical protein
MRKRPTMSSRERMLAAMSCGPVDHVPCSFMIFFNLRDRCATPTEYVERQLAMDLDACAHAGYLRPSPHPDARQTVWTESEGSETVFCRRIDTPRGPLTQRVVQRQGWPTEGNFWPFNDYVIPRSREFLVKPEADLEKLPFLFGPFRDDDIGRLRASAKEARRVADERGLLLAGGWTAENSSISGDDGVMGADAMAWLSGYEEVMVLSLTRPEVVEEYARIINEWNLRQIAIYLDVTAADLIVRRAWYETTEFWTPAAFRRIVAPGIRREAALVHQAGRMFGFIVTSAFLPLLDDLLESGVDVLIGLDPGEGKGTDLAEVKRRWRAGNRALWGGVSGPLTVERGTESDVDAAVTEALRVLGRDGGFILSPVDNVREDTETAWRNTYRFIETWKGSWLRQAG